MKKYLIVLVLGIVMLPHSIHAQEQELAKMKPAQKEKYLRDVATDVVKTCGPDYYRSYMVGQVSTAPLVYDVCMNPNNKDNGREYYIVTFRFDFSKVKESFDIEYTSEIYIWADNGEPMNAFFDGYGYTFIKHSYKDIKANIKPIPLPLEAQKSKSN